MLQRVFNPPKWRSLLSRELSTEQLDQLRCVDITYVRAQSRWHYLAALLDLDTKQAAVWTLSAKLDAELEPNALDVA